MSKLNVKSDPNPQIRQSAAVMLRLRVKKRWKKMNPNDRERFSLLFLILHKLIYIYTKF